MEKDIDVQLTQKALRIKEIEKLSTRALVEGKLEELWSLLDEYVVLKKSVKELLCKKPTFQIVNKVAREIVRRVGHDEVSNIDRIIDAVWKSRELPEGEYDLFHWDEFDWGEIDRLADEHFLIWGSHLEYTQNLVKISSLILGIKVPENLASFVHEAKYCYAFSQYIAVYALCRTILETAIRDICIKRGIIIHNVINV